MYCGFFGFGIQEVSVKAIKVSEVLNSGLQCPLPAATSRACHRVQRIPVSKSIPASASCSFFPPSFPALSYPINLVGEGANRRNLGIPLLNFYGSFDSASNQISGFRKSLSLSYRKILDGSKFFPVNPYHKNYHKQDYSGNDNHLGMAHVASCYGRAISLHCA